MSDPDHPLLAWNAPADFVAGDRYEIERSLDGLTYVNIGTSTLTDFVDGTVSGNVAYVYRVRTVDAAGNPSAYSNLDLATAISFSDGPNPRAGYVNQVRVAVDSVRQLAGLANASWSEPLTPCVITIPITCIPLRALHMQELRDRLYDAFQAPRLQALAVPSDILVPILPLQPVSKTDIDHVRNAVR